MTSLDFLPESFDAVVSFYALIHVPVEEQKELVLRIGTWLRPGGVCLLTTGVRAWTGFDDFYGTTMYWSYPDLGTFKAWLDEANIEILETEHIPEPPGAGHELLVGSRRTEGTTR
jgi:SAM-dependent methyltransferase